MINKIAKKYNINLHKVKAGDKYCKANGIDTYLNKSYSSGSKNHNPEIWLGIYYDKELKLISFFHELGHILCKRKESDTIYQMEEKAWKKGIKIANKYEIFFSDETLKWSKNQLKSYEK